MESAANSPGHQDSAQKTFLPHRDFLEPYPVRICASLHLVRPAVTKLQPSCLTGHHHQRYVQSPPKNVAAHYILIVFMQMCVICAGRSVLYLSTIHWRPCQIIHPEKVIHREHPLPSHVCSLFQSKPKLQKYIIMLFVLMSHGMTHNRAHCKFKEVCKPPSTPLVCLCVHKQDLRCPPPILATRIATTKSPALLSLACNHQAAEGILLIGFLNEELPIITQHLLNRLGTGFGQTLPFILPISTEDLHLTPSQALQRAHQLSPSASASLVAASDMTVDLSIDNDSSFSPTQPSHTQSSSEMSSPSIFHPAVLVGTPAVLAGRLVYFTGTSWHSLAGPLNDELVELGLAPALVASATTPADNEVEVREVGVFDVR